MTITISDFEADIEAFEKQIEGEKKGLYNGQRFFAMTQTKLYLICRFARQKNEFVINMWSQDHRIRQNKGRF